MLFPIRFPNYMFVGKEIIFTRFFTVVLYTDKLDENIKIIQKERCDDAGNELWYQMMLEHMRL